MIYKHMIESLEKYSFVSRVERGTNFYIKIYYKVNKEERYKSISRRASGQQLQDLVEKIKEETDKPTTPKFEDDMPIEVVKYG